MKKLILISAILLSAMVMNAQVQSPAAKTNNSQVSVKISDIPKAITDNIAKSYAGYTIKEAFTLIQEGKTDYKIIINKGTMNEALLYDASGNFIKKMEANSGAMAEKHAATKPASKPGAKKSPGGKK
jgi:cytochrome oxidase Cu insertion factor (SCO1/SenC/PrrC family)